MDDKLLQAAARIGSLLKSRAETVAVAESSTGGLISAALLSVPGASAYFLGGAVVYTRKARELLTGIGREAMRTTRSSSEPYAMMLARDARERYGAHWGISETGAAGPSGNTYGDASGHSCMAVSGTQERVSTLETGSTDRVDNMHRFALSALQQFEQVLRNAA